MNELINKGMHQILHIRIMSDYRRAIMFDYAGVGQYQKAFGNPHLNHGMYGHTWFSMV
jgi:hypothetical protein